MLETEKASADRDTRIEPGCHWNRKEEGSRRQEMSQRFALISLIPFPGFADNWYRDLALNPCLSSTKFNAGGISAYPDRPAFGTDRALFDTRHRMACVELERALPRSGLRGQAELPPASTTIK